MKRKKGRKEEEKRRGRVGRGKGEEERRGEMRKEGKRDKKKGRRERV